MKRTYLVAAISLAAAATISLTFRNYYGQPTIQLLDGTTAKGLSVAEVGEYSGPGFANAEKRYLSNLKAYREFSFIPIPETAQLSFNWSVASLITNSIPRDAETAKILSDPALCAALSEAVALRLERGAGMPLDLYQQETGYTPIIPKMLRDETYLNDVFRSEMKLPADNTGALSIAENLDAQSINHRGQDGRWVAIADDIRACRVAAVRQEPDARVGDILDGVLDKTERNFFRGSMGQGQLVFFTNENSIGSIRCEVSLIVETKSNDIYPVSFRFVLNDSEEWELVAVIRCVSLRAADSPPRVF